MKRIIPIFVAALIWSVASAESTAPKTAMGFIISDEYLPVGWHSFPLDNASQPTTISATDAVSAGAMAKGIYYAQTYTPGPIAKAWNTLDVNTGELTPLATCGDDAPLYVDMTYDYADKKLWGITHYGGNSTMLCEVNVADGSVLSTTDVAGKWLMTLACSYDGDIYSLCSDGYLYKFDKPSEQFSSVGFTDYDIDYMQSMEFDHSTETLYWASCSSYNSGFYTINPSSGASTRISSLGTGGEMTGLYIPFSLADDNAPGEVTKITVDNSAHDTSVSFRLTLPAETAGGSVLAEITSVTIECDGTPIKTLTAEESALLPGAAIVCDTQVEEGFHTFKLYAANTAGNGLPATVKTFVGEDIPSAPASLTLIPDGNNVTISWDAVTTGAQGGYVDVSTMTYTVVRRPGDVTAASATKQTSCTDQVGAMGVYRYEITAANAKGSSTATESAPTVIGNHMNIPFAAGFDSDDEILMWSITDANEDGAVWQRVASSQKGNYMKFGGSRRAADDWLISPPIQLEAGKSYKVIYDDWCLVPSYAPTYEITFGRGNTPEAQQNVLKNAKTEWFEAETNYVYLPEITETGTYNIGIHAKWEPGYPTLHIANFKVEENHAATLNATVTDGTAPLAGAAVEFGEEKTIYTTDENGRIEVVEIEAGTYPVTVSLFGFEPQTLDLTFAELENKEVTIPLTEYDKGTVSGRVFGKDGHGLPDASIYLHGYAEYNAVTDRDGNYTIDGIYRKGEYILDAHCINYEPASVAVGEIAETNTADAITLKEKLIAPDNVADTYDRMKVDLTWDAPVDRTATFRYDDGTDNMVFSMEMSVVTDYTAVGVIYDTPAVFTSMQWNVWNSAQSGADVDVIVFDLDENGRPTNHILYEENNLESSNYDWMECVFRHPIIAPRGALFTLRGDARLCMDGSSDDDFKGDKMVFTHDYRTEPFMSELPGGTSAFYGNLTLRAEGLPYGAPRLAARSRAADADAKYDVFRMAETDRLSVDKWVRLTDTPVETCAFTDTDWANVEKGRYVYAVKAVYSDGHSSYASFSPMVPRLLTTDIVLSVTTDTPGETAEGATVTLTGIGNSNSYTTEVAADGTATFSGVWEGSYRVTCAKKGYATVEKDIEASGAADYSGELALTETTQAPANLLVEETDTPTERLLRWNVVDGIFDDFEGHEDWTINSPGETGWTYIDGDDCRTYSSPNYEFPNMYEKMAFIVLNPSKTDYSMVDNDFMNAHSGERVLVSWATNNGEPNNDFIISPELNMPVDFAISFWARCYYSRYPETLRVGYSTSGNNAEDFEWVGDPITVDDEIWKQFIVNIPGGAKYVALNYISADKYYIALDDIFIGAVDKIPAPGTDNAPARKAGSPISYEVYLDGSMTASTSETQYLLQNLSEGRHTAGVKSRFASGLTEMTTAEFSVDMSGIGSVGDAAERITVDGRRVDVATAPGCVTIYSVDGRTVYSAHTACGNITTELPAGVYIVKTPVASTMVAIR